MPLTTPTDNLRKRLGHLQAEERKVLIQLGHEFREEGEVEKKMREAAWMLDGMTLDEIRQLEGIEVKADDEECFVITQEISDGIVVENVPTSVWVEWTISGSYEYEDD